MKLTPQQMINAFGIAGYSATLPSLRKFFESPYSPMTKYDHLGVVTQSGISAALMAQRGFTGDPEVLEGSVPFWKLASTNGCDWDFLTADLGSMWTIDQVWYKPYPVALPLNATLDMVRQIVREHNLNPKDITRIEIRTERQMRQPDRPVLRNSLDAWLDRAYNIAVAAFDVHPWRAWQEPRSYQNEAILALARKVEFGAMRDGEVGEPGNYWQGWAPARATIELGGQSYAGSVDYLRKLGDRELSDKFQENVGGLMDARAAAQLEQRCWDVAKLQTTRELTDLLPSQLPASSGTRA
jgi:2-methylcitrate dehydratase PrpD